MLFALTESSHCIFLPPVAAQGYLQPVITFRVVTRSPLPEFVSVARTEMDVRHPEGRCLSEQTHIHFCTRLTRSPRESLLDSPCSEIYVKDAECTVCMQRQRGQRLLRLGSLVLR